MDTDSLVIGGGLSGLALAHHLHGEGADWQLLEARTRWGGRILSLSRGQAAYDLGPAWFWPGQPRLDRLARSLGVARFEQAYRGTQVFEDARGSVQRGRGMASMQGSLRLDGGFQALIDALVATLPDDRCHPGQQVTQIRDTGPLIEVTTAAGETVTARQVVLALPPRIAADLDFSPALPGAVRRKAQGIPTWMAGHAKAVALYDRPFWKEKGLSGDAQSQRGPLVEIHDASTMDGAGAALFGFVGTPPQIRAQQETALRDAIRDQLGRLFGPQAAQPAEVLVQDWAFEPQTANALDHQPLVSHPAYGRPAALQGLWGNRLHFGSTEMASTFGGYLEGALEAAEDVAGLLGQSSGSQNTHRRGRSVSRSSSP